MSTQASLSFVLRVVFLFAVAAQTASAQSILVGAPDAGDFFYGMCCNHQEATAAEFSLSSAYYVTTIDLSLVGSSIYDVTLQDSLTGAITTFASAVLNVPPSESMTVEAWLPAGTYYLVAIQDPQSNLRVPGWFASDGTLVTNAGSVTNGAWSSNEGGLAGPWSFSSGPQFNAPIFSVNGFLMGQFVTVAPCRLVDTRSTGGPIQGGKSRIFKVPQLGGCNIPSTAVAYSLNVTIVPRGPLGYLTMWPSEQPQPLVSTLNSFDGRVKASAAIVPAGASGAVSVFVTDQTDVILDIDGYFVPPNDSTLAFYPLPPCRVADTRNPNGDLGGPSLTGGVPREFPVLEASSCNISSSAKAYSLNLTVVPHGPLGFLTVWPTGQSQPGVSTLNSYAGQLVANAAIVPSGTDGKISTFASNDTDLVIDINGYFAAPGQGGLGQQPLSLYSGIPCRVLDTRMVGNEQPFSGERTVDVPASLCGIPTTAQAFVFNATVVPPGPLGFLTLWPDGSGQPGVSTLNAADGAVTSNMAIVPSSNQGMIDAFASDPTQLILDISSYFAP